MEPQELRLMLKDLESDLIERKASLSDPDRIRQAICAFANDHPFDLHPVPSATIKDLDLDLFEREYLRLAIAPEVLAQNTRSMEDKLKALRFGNGQEVAVSSPIIAFFNNKGGVGKTSLVYHLSWMYADMGLKVLAADLDPQANLTAEYV